MRNPSLKSVLLNIFISIVLYIIFLISTFLWGYGSNNNYLHREENVFVGVAIFHFLVNLFLLYKYNKLNWIFASISMILIAAYYFVEAWQFGYLGISILKIAGLNENLPISV